MDQDNYEEQEQIELPIWPEIVMAHNTLDNALESGVYDVEPLWRVVFIGENGELDTDLIGIDDLLELNIEDGDGNKYTEDDLIESYLNPEHELLMYKYVALLPYKPDIVFQNTMMLVARDVLCWILGHDNPGFLDNMARTIEAMGIQQEEE